MNLAPSTRIQQGTRTAARVIDGQAVVVVVDAQQLHTLNEVGTRVWELAQKTRLDEIAEAIAAEFEVDVGEALADVRRFAGELLQQGMLEIAPEDGA